MLEHPVWVLEHPEKCSYAHPWIERAASDDRDDGLEGGYKGKGSPRKFHWPQKPVAHCPRNISLRSCFSTVSLPSYTPSSRQTQEPRLARQPVKSAIFTKGLHLLGEHCEPFQPVQLTSSTPDPRRLCESIKPATCRAFILDPFTYLIRSWAGKKYRQGSS